MKMRLLSLFIAVIIVIATLPALPFTAQAAYENTYVNTGDQVADILGVALTQVGYTEGENNYTKYGVWYGYPNTAWCGMFVAWCADQANIPTSVLKKYARSNPQGYGLEELHSDSYRPKPGDLFFNSSYSHVGFVYYLDGDHFYTLEGNTGPNSDSVCIRRRVISEYTYGSPNYRGGGEHSYTTAYDTEHPHKEYKTCSHCSDKYYTGNTTSVSDCTTCIQAACSHNYGAWSKEDSSSHIRTCTACGKTDSQDHNWGNDSVTSSPTCAKNGFKDQTCVDCEAARTVSIPKTEDHNFSEMEYTDEEIHSRECSVCGLTEDEPHSVNDHWFTDESDHWYFCNICGDKYALDSHVFPDGCESPCQDCGYEDPVGHTPGPQQCDDTGHWYECETCGKTFDYGEHSYRADCAETCDVCDYTRQTSHNFDTAWHFDDYGHWQECNVCGLLQEQSAHNPDTLAKDWEDQLCTDCGYMLRSADEHIHTYHTVYMNDRTHWGQCACGYEMEAQAHSWSIQTQTCTVCSADSTSMPENAESQHMIYWGIIIAAGLGIISLTAVLCVKAGKKKQLTTV